MQGLSMALHGKFVINDADYSPLSFPGVGTFLAFSGNGAYRNRGACGMIPKEGLYQRVNTGLLTVLREASDHN